MRRNKVILVFASTCVGFLLLLPDKPNRNVVKLKSNVADEYSTAEVRFDDNTSVTSTTREKLTTKHLSADRVESDNDIAERFQNRVKTMKSRCPGWELSPHKRFWVVNTNFLIHYNRRLLVCAVPKAGSTTWHMMIWAMRQKEAGKSTNVSLYTYEDTVDNHHTAQKLTREQGMELVTYREGDDDMFKDPSIGQAKRIILTRHPFARLISGWHQKFLPDSPYAKLMLERYPRLRSFMKLDDPNHRIAWKDFAAYIAAYGLDTNALDYHFKPTAFLCKPCLYAYSYIVKAESIDRDEAWLKKRLDVTDIEMGRKGVPPGGSLVNSNPSDKIKYFMRELDDFTRKRLFKIYEEDFKMFGYTFNFKTLESGGFD